MVALLAALVVALAPFPHARATSSCGARAIPFQQQALAAAGDAIWVACRDARLLERIDGRGSITRRARLGAFRPWAIAAGTGSLWAIDRDRPELSQLDAGTGKRLRTIALPATPAALWFGAGAVWVGFDAIGFARVDPRTRRVSPTFSGDGVSAFATDGRTVFAVSHRDNAIQQWTAGRVTQLATRLVEPATASTEQAVFAQGALWITGRGLDLLRVDVHTGRTTATVEIGPAGLAVTRAGEAILVASYSERGARRGDPIAGRLSVVDPGRRGVSASVTASAPVYLSGLAIHRGAVVAVDTVQGRFLRIPLP